MLFKYTILRTNGAIIAYDIGLAHPHFPAVPVVPTTLRTRIILLDNIIRLNQQGMLYLPSLCFLGFL